MGEQVILPIELSHGDRFWVEDKHVNLLVHPTTHRGLALQSCQCVTQYFITLKHTMIILT